MKHKIIFVLITALLIVLAVPSPATAYTGISGGVIDSRTLTAWQNGADVWIVNNTTGDVEATGMLDLTTGRFSLTWGTDELNSGLTDMVAPAANNQLEVIIDFTCGWRNQNSPPAPAPPATCPPLNGTPTTMSVGVTQNNLPFIFSIGTNLETGTGPTSVQLVDFSVSQPATQNTWLPYLLLLGSVILVSGAVTILRKRRA